MTGSDFYSIFCFICLDVLCSGSVLTFCVVYIWFALIMDHFIGHTKLVFDPLCNIESVC